MPHPRAARRLTAILAVLLTALVGMVSADTLHMKNGSTLDGRIVGEDKDGYDFKANGAGQVRIARDKVDWLEPADKEKAKADFETMRKAAADAEALVAAGRWAQFRGLKAEASLAFKNALDKDPQNAGANEGLGRHKQGDKWLSEDEYMTSTGHVKHAGKWVTKDEADKLDKGWELVDGKLVSPDDVKKAKGLVQVDGKWMTKKEAEKLGKVVPGAAAKPGEPEPKWGDTPKPPKDPRDDAAILKYFGAGWRVIPGERYRLITDCTDTDLDFDKKFVKSMDDFWAVYCEVLATNPVQKKIHNIVVHKDKAQFDAWCDKNAGAGKGAYGVYVHSHTYALASLWHSEYGLRGALYTARHEGAHQFVQHYVRQDGGMWFSEGFAALFEPDIKMPQYPTRWDVIRAAVFDKKGDLTMRELIEGKNLTAGQGYAIGAATHWFFLTSKKGVYRKAYQEFLKKGAVDSVKALEKAVGKTIDELDKEYREFIREGDKLKDVKPGEVQTGPAPYAPLPKDPGATPPLPGKK